MAACLPETFSTDLSPSQPPQAAWCRAACRMAEDPQPGARPRGTAAPGVCSDFLTHRSSQPNHVIWRLNNSDAALKCW